MKHVLFVKHVRNSDYQSYLYVFKSYFIPLYRLYFKMSSINSKRNSNILYHDGFKYVFDKLSANGQTTFWQCRGKYLFC